LGEYKHFEQLFFVAFNPFPGVIYALQEPIVLVTAVRCKLIGQGESFPVGMAIQPN
jgi:hypothetical protein